MDEELLSYLKSENKKKTSHLKSHEETVEESGLDRQIKGVRRSFSMNAMEQAGEAYSFFPSLLNASLPPSFLPC